MSSLLERILFSGIIAILAAARCSGQSKPQTGASSPATTVPSEAKPESAAQAASPPSSQVQATDSTANPVEPPGAVFKEAMHPLDVVRQSMDNWSDAELGALKVGMQMAREACERDNPDDYSGDDLFDLAHL